MMTSDSDTLTEQAFYADNPLLREIERWLV